MNSGIVRVLPAQKLPCFSISRDEEKFGKQKVFMKTDLTKHQKTPDIFFDEQGDT
nr:hypothetical protein [uncultured Oscillibacter sp.]